MNSNGRSGDQIRNETRGNQRDKLKSWDGGIRTARTQKNIDEHKHKKGRRKTQSFRLPSRTQTQGTLVDAILLVVVGVTCYLYTHAPSGAKQVKLLRIVLATNSCGMKLLEASIAQYIRTFIIPYWWKFGIFKEISVLADFLKAFPLRCSQKDAGSFASGGMHRVDAKQHVACIMDIGYGTLLYCGDFFDHLKGHQRRH